MGIDILTLAAARAGKGGGSASKYKQPDWGAETAIVDLLPETELTVMEEVGAALLMQEVTLTEGNVYTVNFNGTEYDCTAVHGDNMSGVALGNVGAMLEGMPVTDDPFIFMAISEEDRENFAGACAMVVPLDGSTTFTLSIKGEKAEIHTIPAEYIQKVEPLYVQANGSTSTVSCKKIVECIKAGIPVFFLTGVDGVAGTVALNLSMFTDDYVTFTGIRSYGTKIRIHVIAIDKNNDVTERTYEIQSET